MITKLLPTTLREVFEVGMDRELSELLPFPEGEVLNLGAGKKEIATTRAMDIDRGWVAPKLPWPDKSLAGAFAFHFLEHLAKDEVIGLLRELERTLVPGGSLIAVTPHRLSSLAFQDLDHKSFWTETTFNNLFSNPYYDGTMPRNWKFRLHASVIMGIVERNLVVVNQIEKMGK